MSGQQRRRILRDGLFLALCLCLGAMGAAAEGVQWQQGASIQAGEIGELDLVFSDLKPKGKVKLPKIKDLEFLGEPSRSTSYTIINFKRSSSVTLGYRVRPKRQGKITIPAFSVSTNKGAVEVPRTELVVGDAVLPSTSGGAAVRMEDAVVARLSPSSRDPYAGEVIDVDYVVAVVAGRRAELSGKLTWEPQGVVAEDWSSPEQLQSSGMRGVRFRNRMLVPNSGTITLPEASQDIQIETGRMVRRGFFSQPEVITFGARSKPVELTVRPLPQAPPGFSGAVGQFQLDSKVVPESTSVGEPITWTLGLEGTGNWPSGVSLPGRIIPNSIRTLAPKTSRSFEKGKLFTGAVSEDLVLIPLTAGEIQLEPVRFIYFDPKKEQYETLVVTPPVLHIQPAKSSVLPAPGVSVQGAAAPRTQAKIGSGAGQSGQSAFSTPIPPPEEIKSSEPRLPREPKTGASTGFAPLDVSWLAVVVATPFALLLIFWMSLALRLALQRDPNRSRREARRQLAELLSKIGACRDEDELHEVLLQWQNLVRILLGVVHAAPTAAVLENGVSKTNSGIADEMGTAKGWVRCWREAEVVLYAREGELPQDWIGRVEMLVQQQTIPGFNPFGALRWRNLMPAIVLFFLVSLSAIIPCGRGVALADPPADTSRTGSSVIEAYQKGEFAQTESLLRERLASEPRNWKLHYNLGLALFQQQHHAEALAEATAAFLSHSWDSDLRWNLRLFAQEMGVIDPALRALLFPEGWSAPLSVLASWLSPALWQGLLVAGAFLLCTGLAGLLFRRFPDASGGPQPSREGAGTMATKLCIGLGIAAMLFGAFSLAEYGVLASPTAAMVIQESAVRSVPTAAEKPQAKRNIPAAALVTIQKHFLGWVRVRLPNGDLGWVRHEAIAPLYASLQTYSSSSSKISTRPLGRNSEP